MAGNKEDEKKTVQHIFRDLNQASLSYHDEEIVTSLEEYFDAFGRLSAKQKALLMDIRERYL